MYNTHHRKKGKTGWEEYKDNRVARTKYSTRKETKDLVDEFMRGPDCCDLCLDYKLRIPLDGFI